MPVPTWSSVSSSEPDTYSMLSQATTTMTIGDSLPAQLVRKSARRGFTFNIMSVGPPCLGKTTILSALFGKNLEFASDHKPSANAAAAAAAAAASKGGDQATAADLKHEHATAEHLNPPVVLDAKTFEIDDKSVRLKLTSVECRNYGEALCLTNTHLPLVEYIDSQFADYHKRESGVDRKNIQDKMVHCLLFYISPIGHGLSKLDLEFLKAVHSRVNVIPIIAKSEALTLAERVSFKRRVREDLERNGINVYQMPEPDPDDSKEIKRVVVAIRDSWPFAVSSMVFKPDNTLVERHLDYGRIDLNDKDHSDFLLLKTMLHMQMPELCETTLDVFYEDYRLRKMAQSPRIPTSFRPPLAPKPDRF